MKITNLCFNKELAKPNNIKYLEKLDNIKNLLITPDFGNNGFVYNGLFFESKEILHPLTTGSDVGCGFQFSFFEMNEHELASLMKKLDMCVEINSFNPIYRETDKEVSLEQGNHFIEIRKIKRIIDKDSFYRLVLKKNAYILMIHAGCSSEISNRIKRKQIQLIKSLDNMNTSNGYLPTAHIKDKWSLEYFNLVENAICYARNNRNQISELLFRKNDKMFTVDVMHDYVQIDGTSVLHFKSVQKFKKINDIEIALMPGDKNDDAYIVKKGELGDKVNHGLCMNYENDAYISSEETIKFCKRIRLSTPIMSLQPVITIKNINGYITRIN